MFLFGGKREQRKEGLDSPWLQTGPDRAGSDPEKQPKQEEGCELMTKQNTGSQRDTLLEDSGQAASLEPFLLSFGR